MIKVSDYIARCIAKLGVRHVFMISGGGAMHLNDSIGSRKDIEYICNHHEQASAIAAEGYARISGNIGVCVVTSGPGGTNTVTGVLGQWLDSIPALYLSGQVRYETTVESTRIPLRQLGDQEANIVAIVSPITKYAVMVTDPLSIRYHFERAVYLARSGRPGPVWIDIPLNVQAAMVDESRMAAYDPAEDAVVFDKDRIGREVSETLDLIRKSFRPVLLAGNGIRLAGGVPAFRRLIERLNIPVQTGFGGHDLIPSDHPLFFGRPSITGDRSSNFIVQNADLLLCIGTRLGVRQISYNYRSFARGAYKIVVDIDPVELRKPTIFPDMMVHCDAKTWIEELIRQIGEAVPHPNKNWMGWCAERRRRYPSVLPEYRKESGFVNSYHFIDVLSDLLGPEDTLVLANGTANTCTFQAVRLKKGQRLFTNSGCASMGYDLPAAIGACLARSRGRTICLAGDGSIQMNLQELQTVVHHRLPIKIFVLSNDGYLSIRGTQESFFGGRYVASNRQSGVSTPDVVKIANAYGIPSFRLSRHEGMETVIQEVLETEGPALCDIAMDPNQALYPKVASERLPDGRMVSKPLEDMYPFLERAELLENMIIPPWKPEE